MNKMKRYIKRLFFPARCEYCKRVISFTERECIHCDSLRQRIPEDFCIHCNKRRCICDDDTHRLTLSVPYIYSGSTKSYIHRYKFAREKLFADFFADSLYKAVINDFDTDTFDYVTFIPSADGAKNTFHHGELLGRSLAKRLYCSCTPLLVRTRHIRKQHYLSFEERIKNMHNAFSVIEGFDLTGKTVLICDDIKTSGSTLLAAEKALLDAGAEKVYCCAVATPVFAADSPLDKESKKL